VRVDVAVDVRYPSASAGRAVIDALRSQRLSHGHYVQEYGNPVTTVAQKRKSGKTVARCYCRNSSPTAKLETGPMYGLLRFEVEKHFPAAGDRRIMPEQLESPAFARMLWEERFGTPNPSGGGTKLSRIAREVQTVKLADRVQLGEMGYAQFERMTAFLDAERLGIADRIYSTETLSRRRREARSLGLVANDALYEPQELDLDDLLSAPRAAFA
jgi:hypothetical protein